jgi:S1-C subfamily serine protease/regulation of enolase protein 1 (concanavalin A-like superfamily)
VVFNVDADAGQSGSLPATGARRSASSPSIPSAGLSRHDESDAVHDPPSISRRPAGRQPQASMPDGAGGNVTIGHKTLLYALFGVSGLVVVLLGAVLVLLFTRGGGGGGGQPAPIAQAAPPAQPEATPVQPAAGAPGITPTSLTEVSNENRVAAAPTPSLTAATPAPASSISAPAAPRSHEEILRHLKDASVYIKNKIAGRTISSGSGFVIEVNSDRVVVATNRHVAVPDLSGLPPGVVPLGSRPEVEAVFRSGLPEEQVLPAQIIAADQSGEMKTDLAFLLVRGLKKPLTPIELGLRLEASSGMTYIGAGFPLGGMLSKVTESKGNPEVTITGGLIARLQRDPYGHVDLLQVDGSLQPGNSGGPLIDEKTGQLFGVAVAKVGSVDTIGFAVPAAEVQRALDGRVGSLELTLESNQEGVANLQVKALLVDPRVQVGGVVVHAAPAAAVSKLSPDGNGNWPVLPNTKPFELQRSPRDPSASGQVQVAVSGSGLSARKILVQTAHRDLRGRWHYAKPREVTLPEHPGKIRPAGQFQHILDLARAPSIKKLGPLIDPARDCRLFKDDQHFRITIDIPGKVHALSPRLTDGSRRPITNAPMTLTEVEGDFVSVVQVSGEMNPGSTLPRERAVRGLTFTFQSAGLIVFLDKNNFFRLERAASVDNRLRPIHRLYVEAVKDGKPAMDPILVNVPESEMQLVLQRKKDRLRCMFVLKETNQVAPFRDFAFSLPPKVKVGLSASNISAQPFTATFENFTLLSNSTALDEELND